MSPQSMLEGACDAVRDVLESWGLSVNTVTRRAVLLGVAVGVGVYWLTRKRYRLPPGPRPWPVVGNIPQIGNTVLYKRCFEWYKEYGPVFSMYIGPQLTIVLSRSDVVLEALVKRGSDFAGRPQSYVVSMITGGGQDIAQAPYGPGWKLRRKIATKAIKRYMTGSSLEEKTDQALRIAMAAMEEEPGAFDPHRYLFLITVNILCAVCFNNCYEHDDPEFSNLLEHFDAFVQSLSDGIFLEDIIPPLRLFPTRRFRNMCRANSAFVEFLLKHIGHHVETFDANNIRDLTDSVLAAQREVQEDDAEEDREALSELTDKHICYIIGDIFSAGNDTTRLTLYWILLYMAAFPEIQAKAQQEIDAAVGRERTPKLSDRSRLPYTEAVLYESMRLGNAVPFGVPHTTICDSKIGEYDIPKDSFVIINHWALHHDPDQWEDVDTFKPERFLDSSGKMAPKPESWLPFSAGRRVCLGETVVKPELHLLVASLLQDFKIKLPDGVTADLSPHATSMVFGKPNSYRICMEKRY